jgi:potassium uptake TrkH family protein
MKWSAYHIIDLTVTILAPGMLSILVWEYGYGQPFAYEREVYALFGSLLALETGYSLGRHPGPLLFRRNTRIVLLISGLLVMVFSLLSLVQVFPLHAYWLVRLLVLLLSLTLIIERLFRIETRRMHPALIFVSSFAVLIGLGTLLLLLPQSAKVEISLVDALFTATSAVCVTGLTVLTTGEDFTLTGQAFILVLLQLGGLGMLTFTNVFGLFFRSFGSFRNRLMLQDMINSRTIEGTKGLLVRILVFTLVAEGIGALLIYGGLATGSAPDGNRAWFAIFHAISAFCNAGFSTLPQSLYEETFRMQYGVHLTIAALIILGGIGFNTIIGYLQYMGEALRYYFYRVINRADRAIPASLPLLSANDKLVLRTTTALLVAGTLGFYFFEGANSLSNQSSFGQWATAFFGSVTARTAGFNSFDTGSLAGPTLLLLILLMWVGASPGSTGGGIKTTTFGIALLNIWQQVLGRNRIVLGWRSVPVSALNRALAIIMLSLPGIGVPVFLLYHFEPGTALMPIVFECVSAYCTVGLSMGITEQLSEPGKLTLIATMFIGRVGFLTFLTGLARQWAKEQHDPARYPEEDIFIN